MEKGELLQRLGASSSQLNQVIESLKLNPNALEYSDDEAHQIIQAWEAQLSTPPTSSRQRKVNKKDPAPQPTTSEQAAPPPPRETMAPGSLQPIVSSLMQGRVQNLTTQLGKIKGQRDQTAASFAGAILHMWGPEFQDVVHQELLAQAAASPFFNPQSLEGEPELPAPPVGELQDTVPEFDFDADFRTDFAALFTTTAIGALSAGA